MAGNCRERERVRERLRLRGRGVVMVRTRVGTGVSVMGQAVRRCCGIALLVAPLLAVGCGGEGTGPDDGGDAAEGTYTLVSVNDETPPVTVYSTTLEGGSVFEIRITDGEITLGDGRYELTLEGEAWQDGQKLQLPGGVTDVGSYSVSGQTVTFDSDNEDLPGTIQAVLDGNELKQTVRHPEYGEFTAVFRK
ncbi:MAG TPA: hypothetical protein VF188_17265 [Longimicrobiales bacterium]